MEESIVIIWFQDLRGFGRGKFGDKVYFLFGFELELSNLFIFVCLYIEFMIFDLLIGIIVDCDYFDFFL